LSVSGSFQVQFIPTRESSSVNGEEKFLTEHPTNVIPAGVFHKVPFVVGTVLYESAVFMGKFPAMALNAFRKIDHTENDAINRETFLERYK
jgi:hypothetical protein